MSLFYHPLAFELFGSLLMGRVMGGKFLHLVSKESLVVEVTLNTKCEDLTTFFLDVKI